MKKRILSVMLALAMCLSLFSVTTFAAASISLNKTNCSENEKITVFVSGITEKMVEDAAFIAVYNANAEHSQYNQYLYPELGDSSLEFEGLEYGLYEMRLYSKDGQYDDTTLVTKTAFSVDGAVATADVKIQLDKATYASGEKIEVIISGVTQKMLDDEAFVAIYKAGANHDQWGAYDYPKHNTDKVELTAPEEHGAYEMRFYRKDQEYTDETFVTKVPFNIGTVSNSLPGKIALANNAYLANGNIEVSYSEIPEQYEKEEAFVAIYKKGAKHNEYGAYEYVKTGNGIVTVKAPNMNGEFEMRLYSEDSYYSDATFVMSVPFTLSGATASEWALTELDEAEKLGLVPDSLKGTDLTQSITRAEFAAVSVKAYEALSGICAIPSTVNPFEDTSDIEVLKAYDLGITTGTSDTTFAPDTLLNREQAATMLTRTFKKATMNGWTLQTDANFPLTFDKPAPFADDAKISAWAKDSVYFMAANGIIAGVGDNKFAPQNITTEEQATGYANATREQALIIAARMVKNLK